MCWRNSGRPKKAAISRERALSGLLLPEGISCFENDTENPSSPLSVLHWASSSTNPQLLLQNHKTQIVPLRDPKAIVAVGKGVRLAGFSIAASNIPGVQRGPDVDDADPDAFCPAFAHPVFRGGKQSAAKAAVLLLRFDRQGSEIPGAAAERFEPDAALQRALARVAPRQERRLRACGEVRAKKGLRRPVAGYVLGFRAPAGRTRRLRGRPGSSGRRCPGRRRPGRGQGRWRRSWPPV